MIIWFATGNNHKKKELAVILAAAVTTQPRNQSWELKIPSDAGIDFNPNETGSSFPENALIKARELHRILKEKGVLHQGDPVIADDSGICVDALGGRPGIYSARYGGPEIKSDAERNALLLEELGDNPRRSARFVCGMVLYYSPDRFYVALETLEGELVKDAASARGEGGFGYDPILYIPELGRTVAELTEEEKNRFSHRGKAGRAIAKILNEINTAAKATRT